MPRLSRVEGQDLELIRKDWNGYKVWGLPDDPNVLVIEDQAGNIGIFDADIRPWDDLEDLLALADEDIREGRIEWH